MIQQKESPGSTALAAALVHDARWQLVQRVVSSGTFAGSPPLQDFLLYVAEHALLGRADEIKEQAIGGNVLRRSSDFDPATDNIVRVRARQLRQKLEHYFQSEGLSDPMVILIPRGGYVAVFEPRVEPSPQAEPPAESAHPRKVPRKLPSSWLPWSLCAVLAILCLFLWIGPNRRSRNMGAALTPESQRHWTQVFAKNERTLVVFSDPSFGVWQELTNNSLNLQEYLGMRYRQPKAPANAGLAGLLSSNQISLSAAHFLIGVVPISEALQAGLRVRPARQTDITDFKTGNVILMGSRRSNPWTELFEPHLHYVAVYPNGGPSYFARGSNDASGRQVLDNADARSYAVIALLPNTANTGKVLLIEGLTMEGTDAAIEFLVNPQSCALLVKRLTAELGSAGQPFEALLQLTPVAGGSANVRLIGLQRPLP